MLFFPELDALGSNDHVLFPPGVCEDYCLGWKDERNVRLPTSSCANTDVMKQLKLLTDAKETIEEVTEVINLYQPIPLTFESLHDLFNNNLSKETAAYYLKKLIPGIASLALRLPELITKPIPRLLSKSPGSVSLSQEQVACLLANAFFCTFPPPGFDTAWRKTYFNFDLLFWKGKKCKIEKIKCILHYFDCVLKNMPSGCITVRRHRLQEEINFYSVNKPLCELIVHSEGRIEDTDEEMVEIDFANQFIGGGVLNAGCVQEEIRFMLSPELLISLLICERMDKDEAISILGTQRFNNYTGYADSFKFERRDYIPSTNKDKHNRIMSEVVAINATSFNNPKIQYEERFVLKELTKAYTGFGPNDTMNRPIATGNWGCGAFRGDMQLKSLIQLIAASLQDRHTVHYFTFSNRDFYENLGNIYGMLKKKGVKTGQLLKMIVDYEKEEKKSLFSYLLKCLE